MMNENRTTGITKATFEKQETVESKLSILFDQQDRIFGILYDLKNTDMMPNPVYCHHRWNKCDARFKKMERFSSWLIGGLSVVALILSVGSVAIQMI